MMDELRDGVVGETLGGQSGGGEAALQSLSGCCQAAVLKPRLPFSRRTWKIVWSPLQRDPILVICTKDGKGISL